MPTRWRGHGNWLTRAYRALTYAHYREQINSARARGDAVALAEWQDRLTYAKSARRHRILSAPLAALAMLRLTLIAAAVVGGLLLLVGLSFWLDKDGVTWSEWWDFTADAVNTIGLILRTIAALALAIGPLVWLVGAYRADAASATLPTWAMTPIQRSETGRVVTPGGIAEALVHLGIATLNRAIKDGWTVEFATPPVQVNNRGYQTTFSLPMGVTPDMISDKRAVLARNLHRDPMEVWPNAAGRAGFVDLWVADPGSLSKPAPECPLLTASKVDIFSAVPFGVSQRGDVIAPPLVQANVVFGA